jgi:flagellin-specific chaperone FliS
MKKTNENFGSKVDLASSKLDKHNLVSMVIDKIGQQWKSIKTAFTKINCEKSGYIEREELTYALRNWGLFLNQEQFEYLYKAFDHDGDDIIGYQDFKKTIADKIQPEENLYFRQDNPGTFVLNPNEQRNCWKEQNSKDDKTPFQLKVKVSKVSKIIEKLKNELGETKWKMLTESLLKFRNEKKISK